MTGATFEPAIFDGSRLGIEGGGRIFAGAVCGAAVGGLETGGVSTVKAGNPDPRGLKSLDSELSLVLSMALGSKSSSLTSTAESSLCSETSSPLSPTLFKLSSTL